MRCAKQSTLFTYMYIHRRGLAPSPTHRPRRLPSPTAACRNKREARPPPTPMHGRFPALSAASPSGTGGASWTKRRPWTPTAAAISCPRACCSPPLPHPLQDHHHADIRRQRHGLALPVPVSRPRCVPLASRSSSATPGKMVPPSFVSHLQATVARETQPRCSSHPPSITTLSIHLTAQSCSTTRQREKLRT